MFLNLVIALSILNGIQITDARSKWYHGEDGPYQFAFTVPENQHRQETKDSNGRIMGEFGFITADGIYRVTIYTTDEEGNFNILSMRNFEQKLIKMLVSSNALENPQRVVKSSNIEDLDSSTVTPFKVISTTENESLLASTPSDPVNTTNTTDTLEQSPENKSSSTLPSISNHTIEPTPFTIHHNTTDEEIVMEMNDKESTTPSLLIMKTDSNPPEPSDSTTRSPEFPSEVLQKPEFIDRSTPYSKFPQSLLQRLLYQFHYNSPHHGHSESGDTLGNKEGQYHVREQNGLTRIVSYRADESGFHPRITYEYPENTPKELTNSDFRWFYAN